MTPSPAAEKPNYLALNAMLNLFDENGHIQFDKDQEAARQYFLQDVNKRLRYFKEGLEEKIAYLWKNDYYEREFIEQYDWEFVKRLYKRIYGAKFRFATFVGAYKFYTGYALRSFDGEEYLETYEDRIAAVAMLLGAGNERQATQLADEMINQRYQPATPTFLNAGKKQRGELVSCFPAGSLVSTAGGKRVPIEQVREGHEVATHAGRTRKVVRTMRRTDSNGLVTIKIAGQAKPLTCTPEHPILVHRPKKWETMKPVLRGDGDSDHVWWIRAGDIRPGDFVVAGFESYESSEEAQIDVGSHLQSDVVEIEGRLHVPLKDARWSGKHGRTVSTQTKSLPTHVATSPGFGRFVGYYLAEGHVGNRSVVFTFGSTEDEWMSDVEALSSEIFGLVPERNVRADGSTTVNINSKLLAEFFRSLIGTGFDRKLLPVELLQGSDEFLRGVLVGAFRGDGCTHGQAMVMDMVNLPLIHQLRGVALSVGVPTFERVYANRAGNPTGGLHVPSNSQAGHDFILEVAKNLHRFASSMDKGARSSYAKKIDGRHMFRVSSVEHTPGSNVVYNIEVEEDHTYVVEGIVVHNCFLVEIQDDMHSIGRAVNSALQLSKRGGGVAFNLTNIRAAMDPIKGIKNASSGILPIMKLLEDSFSYANQLGARQGAGAVYLNAHHLDVEAFLDCKKEAADEKVRIKTLSLGIVIPDITLELATKNEEMYLFSPYDVSRKYGKPYSQVNLTKVYRELVDDPKIRKSAFPGGARGFFQHLAEVQFESGYPYVMFEDNVNRQSEIRGKVTMSNLCSEILQVSEASEIDENQDYVTLGKDISCNLGSMNISRAMDGPSLRNTVEAAIRSLTEVSDTSDVAVVPSIQAGNERSHAVGLGQMNLHGYLARSGIDYASKAAVDFTDAYFRTVRYHAIWASTRIARERERTFDGFEHSKYASGEAFEKYLRPYQPATAKVRRLFEEAGHEWPTEEHWRRLAAHVRRHGMYHQNLLAVAPTGSISYVNHATSSIHPITAKIEMRSEGGMGRVYYPAAHMDDDNQHLFRDAYDIGYEALIDIYAAATPHVDQGLSLTLFLTSDMTTRDLNRAQIYAWKKGLKTIYYVRVRSEAIAGTDQEGCVSCAV